MSGFGVAAVGFLAGVAISQADTPLPGPADGVGAIVAGAAAVAGSLLVDIATDPPQPDYKKIVKPVISKLSKFKHTAILHPADRALIADVLDLYGRGTALIEAFERQQFAHSVGDTVWVGIHQDTREALAQELAARAEVLLDLAGRGLECFDEASLSPGKVLPAPSNPSSTGISVSVPAAVKQVFNDFVAFALQRPLKVHPVDFHAALAGLTMHEVRHQGGNAYLSMLESVAAQQLPKNWLLAL